MTSQKRPAAGGEFCFAGFFLNLIGNGNGLPAFYIHRLYVIGQSDGRINIIRNGTGGRL